MWFFNQKIKPNSLPDNLITLIFGYNFNQKIKPNTLPKHLTFLTFGWRTLSDYVTKMRLILL